MMRSAITSEPLTGEAVEMRLPLMSESLLMPVPSMVTKCTRLG